MFIVGENNNCFYIRRKKDSLTISIYDKERALRFFKWLKFFTKNRLKYKNTKGEIVIT